MTRGSTLAGYAVIAAAMAMWQLVAVRRGRRETLGALVRWLASFTAARFALLAAWLWLGWHVFAR